MNLLDVNVLIALAWDGHEHHLPAHAWFGRSSPSGFATCNTFDCATAWWQTGHLRWRGAEATVSRPATFGGSHPVNPRAEPMTENSASLLQETSRSCLPWTPVPRLACLRGTRTVMVVPFFGADSIVQVPPKVAARARMFVRPRPCRLPLPVLASPASNPRPSSSILSSR